VRKITYCKPFQMHYFVQLRKSYSVSRDPSAIAELLVYFSLIWDVADVVPKNILQTVGVYNNSVIVIEANTKVMTELLQ